MSITRALRRSIRATSSCLERRLAFQEAVLSLVDRHGICNASADLARNADVEPRRFARTRGLSVKLDGDGVWWFWRDDEQPSSRQDAEASPELPGPNQNRSSSVQP